MRRYMARRYVVASHGESVPGAGRRCGRLRSADAPSRTPAHPGLHAHAAMRTARRAVQFVDPRVEGRRVGRRPEPPPTSTSLGTTGTSAADPRPWFAATGAAEAADGARRAAT